MYIAFDCRSTVHAHNIDWIKEGCQIKMPPLEVTANASLWWAHPDSNREPKDYESPAPPLSYRPVLHVDYCTRKLSSQGNFIYPYADRRHSHRLCDRVDQRGARGRRLEVAVLLLERGDALLDRGVGLHLCEIATRADGLAQLWSGRRDSNPHGLAPASL